MSFSIAKAMWGTLLNGWLAGGAGSDVGGGNLFSLDMAANRKEEEEEEKVHSLLSDLPLLLLPKSPDVVPACCINGGGRGAEWASFSQVMAERHKLACFHRRLLLRWLPKEPPTDTHDTCHTSLSEPREGKEQKLIFQ